MGRVRNILNQRESEMVETRYEGILNMVLESFG